ncbi:MAG: ABC transporter ATP-binding protein/permease [Cyanobacteria bacterium P01_F01_bin.150]
MERLNFKVFRRCWAIAQPYWFSEEKWNARKLLALIGICLIAYTGLSVVLNNQRGAMISSLAATDESRFWQTVLIFIGVLVVYAPLFAGYTYLRDRLCLEWRRWLTSRFVDRYFSDRAFYRINQNTSYSADSDSAADNGIDNPDQRIAEDVRNFTQESLSLVLVVTDSLFTIIAFSGVLWGISSELVIFLVLYALIGTIVTVGVFGKPLVRLNFEQLKREADFRFSLVRIRENAEAIAFYQGEEQEATGVKERFLAAFDNYKRLLFWELNLNGVTNAYEFLPYVLPAIVVAPAVFSGAVEVGKVSEAQGAFIQVFFSLNVIVARFQSLTAFGAGIDRLYDFTQSLGHLDETEEPDPRVFQELWDLSNNGKSEGTSPLSPEIQQAIAPTLVLSNVTVQTPNHQRTLIKDLSLDLSDSESQSPVNRTSLLVVGPSGAGKSSLLRAIAGLWNAGTGTIQRPELKDLLFLPQKPYMILGTLRQQLLYPYSNAEKTNEQLKQVLQQVNLDDLDERFGGWDKELEWGNVLSLGEQQRLSFARVLLHQPTYAILDESTSALDQDNEATLYQALEKIPTTCISVGHRSSLEAYHQNLLRLTEEGKWTLQSLNLAT